MKKTIKIFFFLDFCNINYLSNLTFVCQIGHILSKITYHENSIGFNNSVKSECLNSATIRHPDFCYAFLRNTQKKTNSFLVDNSISSILDTHVLQRVNDFSIVKWRAPGSPHWKKYY